MACHQEISVTAKAEVEERRVKATAAPAERP
jgi:hypothetical protein